MEAAELCPAYLYLNEWRQFLEVCDTCDTKRRVWSIIILYCDAVFQNKAIVI